DIPAVQPSMALFDHRGRSGRSRRYAICPVEPAVRVAASDIRHPMTRRPAHTTADGQDVIHLRPAEVARRQDRVEEYRDHAIAKFGPPFMVPDRGQPAALDAEDNVAELVLNPDVGCYDPVTM